MGEGLWLWSRKANIHSFTARTNFKPSKDCETSRRAKLPDPVEKMVTWASDLRNWARPVGAGSEVIYFGPSAFPFSNFITSARDRFFPWAFAALSCLTAHYANWTSSKCWVFRFSISRSESWTGWDIEFSGYWLRVLAIRSQSPTKQASDQSENSRAR